MNNIIKISETRWIDLSNLPRNENGNISWKQTIGQKVKFSYDEIDGIFEVISMCEDDRRSIMIKFNDEILTITKMNILDCKLNYMLGFRTSDFKFNKDEIITTKISKILILSQLYIEKKKSYDCECLECHQTFSKSEYKLVKLEGCPYCSGRIAILGKTDMWSTNPYLASLLLNPEDGHTFKEHSNQFVDWRCPCCGKILLHKNINNVNNKGLVCPRCADGLKITEKFMSNLLSTINIDYKTQLSRSTFGWCENYKYDFYTNHNSLNMVIETHGIQHYEESTMTSRSLEEEQENDRLKENLALLNKIDYYVVLNFSHSTLSWMKNSIMNSALPKLLNFKEDDINWNKLFLDSQHSYLKKACDLWNSGKSVVFICDILKLGKTTIGAYLKKGARNGICTYNPQEESMISISNLHTYSDEVNSKPIICLENNHIFKSINLSSIEMSKLYDKNFHHSNISAVCLGTRKSHQGFSFKYITKEEFNISKTESPELTFGDFFILPKSKTS